MSKRAEERGLEAVPPRWRKTKDGKGKVDSALPVRKFYIRAYEQAEKDLALTPEDIKAIITIGDAMLTGTAWDVIDWPDEQNYCEEVLKRFKEAKK